MKEESDKELEQLWGSVVSFTLELGGYTLYPLYLKTLNHNIMESLVFMVEAIITRKSFTPIWRFSLCGQVTRVI